MKCQFCYNTCPRFSPKLKQSGKSRPIDLRCPHCDRLYDSVTGDYYEEKSIEEENQEKINKTSYF